MSDLRAKLIEAGAERIANALANIAHNRGWPSEHPNDYLVIGKALAEKNFDAVLDCLAENALEWFDAVGWTDNADDLINALRGPDV